MGWDIIKLQVKANTTEKQINFFMFLKLHYVTCDTFNHPATLSKLNNKKANKRTTNIL